MYLPAAETLRKRLRFEMDLSCFCLKPETTEHLFFSCQITLQFWQNVKDWLNVRIKNFEAQQILLYNDNLSKDICEMANIIIIMGKYHICKWKKQKPMLNCFRNELKNYLYSLQVLLDTHQPIQKLCHTMLQYLVFKDKQIQITWITSVIGLEW